MTKAKIKELKSKLTRYQRLLYSCWVKNQIHEDSVIWEGGESLAAIIKHEGSKKLANGGYDYRWTKEQRETKSATIKYEHFRNQ